MISLYTTFRPFSHVIYKKIQLDAIKSWIALKPRPDILVIGDDIGVEQICKKYNLKYIPEVRKSKAGTPYCDDFIKRAEKHASHDIMLLCSGDIIINQDTIKVAESISLKEFCICARKKHIDRNNKVLKWATWQAGDYWMHSKGIFDGMPPFLIGRHRNEKWMYRWLINKNTLIDGTGVVTVLHQNHPHDFKPSNKEVAYNARLYNKHYFEVTKWKDTIWYKRNRLFNVGINHANYVLQADYNLVENTSPQRKDWNER